MLGVVAVFAGALASCSESDSNLISLRNKVCASLVQGDTWWCKDAYKNATADGDWPSQAVYMQKLLDALVDPSTCLNTTVAADVVDWIETSQALPSVSGSIMWTWLVFQVQYYDMPRKPGDRIESADTLGRKCWAFAYLRQFWNPSALQKANVSVPHYTNATQTAIPLTMRLCEEVMANCFENTTYTPSRKGTCPLKISDFHIIGFERENAKRGFSVDYPFN
eukprot:Hpha_TRINITY_DN8033_c0_g1::TRINITY_DN8033_c0_g1_i1::g.139989::m.139989